MAIVKCDKCNGTGKLLADEPLSLANLLEPFIEGDRIGFRLKSGASIPKLPSLQEQELMGEVVTRLHGVE